MSSDTERTENAANRRSRTYRLQAAVLRRRNLGESDRILTVFSKEIGKHRFVAKGVRRPGSKLAGHSEPFMVANFFIARTRGLPILTQAETKFAFPRLRLNERAIAVAGMIAERVEMLTAEDEAAPRVYGLIENSLELLDSGAEPDRVLLIFDLMLLDETGFRSSLQTCIECREPLTAVPNAFVVERGGFVCERCSQPGTGSRMVPVDIQKIMRLIDRGELGQVLAVRGRPDLFLQAQQLVSDCVSTITGRDSTASRVIRDLRLEYDHQIVVKEGEVDDGVSGKVNGP